jgi:hypothetical protein
VVDVGLELGTPAAGVRTRVSPSEPIVGAALLGLDDVAADGSAVIRARAELDAAAPSIYI